MQVIKKHAGGLIVQLDADEAFEILQALESHKRKLGRLASKQSTVEQRTAVKQAYNSVERLIASWTDGTGVERKSQPYIIV